MSQHGSEVRSLTGRFRAPNSFIPNEIAELGIIHLVRFLVLKHKLGLKYSVTRHPIFELAACGMTNACSSMCLPSEVFAGKKTGLQVKCTSK